MPPKKNQHDWSWVGTEVKRSQDITRAHRHRAAGISQDKVCKFDLRPKTQASSSRSRADTVDSGASIVILEVKKGSKGPSCSKKKCLGSLRCYNHLGAENIINPEKSRSEYIQESLGPELELRAGGAGLKNYGATCYTTPLYHLAMIFASLQHTNRKVVDPGKLVEALRLDKGNQQDAAEFSKLFMSLLASEFRKQNDPELKTIIKDQFEGQVKHVTQCSRCAYRSEKSASFLELELSLKDGSSLIDRLAELTRPEGLDGDNKYHCPQCATLQPATRMTELEILPPVLHFSLMRFVFDPVTMKRKKSKASITYPMSLNLRDQNYHLRGVVVHHGYSAHHGHFSCEVYNEDDGEWYACNDEEVTKQSEPVRKKAKLDTEDAAPRPSDGNRTSKDAYMLVYKRESKVDPIDPSAAVMSKVEEENAATNEELLERAKKRERLEAEFDAVNAEKMKVLEVISGADHLVPRDALSSWFQAKSTTELSKPFDFGMVDCKHSQIDPYTTCDCRLISSEAFELLSDRLQRMDICERCVEDGFNIRMSELEMYDHIKTFEELNEDLEDGYALPQKWLDLWRKGDLPQGVLPTSEQYSIICQHHQPWHGTRKCEVVSPEALALLQSIFGEFEVHKADVPQCERCGNEQAIDVESYTDWEECKKLLKAIKNHHIDQFHVFDVENIVIPRSFWDTYQEYVKDASIGKPVLSDERCTHGLIDYDPRLDRVRFVSSPGWEMLCDKFGLPDSHTMVTFAANREHGAKFPIKTVSVETCQECRLTRLLDFEETTITVVLVDDSKNSSTSTEIKPNANGRVTRSANAKQFFVDVTKSTKVVDIKVTLYSKTKVSPICQRLYFNDKLLEGSDTVGSLRIPSEGTLKMVELVEQDEDDIEMGGGAGRIGEGFGGTALVERSGCPDCTYENDAGALMCEMCSRPFIV